MPNTPSPQVILGFDFGLRSIGVAVGQMITQSATALTELAAQDGVPDWEKIEELITTWQAEAFVVGLPLNMDGSEQPISKAARRFARRLQGRFHLPTFLVDERLTTFEAKQRMKTSGVKKTKSARADSLAAKIILESWLRERT